MFSIVPVCVLETIAAATAVNNNEREQYSDKPFFFDGEKFDY